MYQSMKRWLWFSYMQNLFSVCSPSSINTSGLSRFCLNTDKEVMCRASEAARIGRNAFYRFKNELINTLFMTRDLSTQVSHLNLVIGLWTLSSTQKRQSWLGYHNMPGLCNMKTSHKISSLINSKLTGYIDRSGTVIRARSGWRPPCMITRSL